MAAAVDSRQAIVDGLIDAAAREDILFVLYYLDKMGTHAAKATACIRTYYLHIWSWGRAGEERGASTDEPLAPQTRRPD